MMDLASASAARPMSPPSQERQSASARMESQPQQEQGQQQQPDENLEQDARFSCSICFDAVTEPVVTQCGHLYCWPCLYRWLAPGMTPQERSFLGMPRVMGPIDESRRSCPVCKSEASARTIVPIYVRSCHSAGGGGTNNAKNSTRTSRRSSPRSLQLQHSTPPQEIPIPQHQQRQLHQQYSSEEEREIEGSHSSPPPIFRQSMNHLHMNSSNDQDDNSGTENMGLNIDGYDEDEGDGDDLGLDHDVPTTITTMIPSATPDSLLGLRRRRGPGGGVTRTESRDEMSTTSTIVPTRPMPSRDRAASNNTEANSAPGNNRDSSTSPPRNSAITIPGNVPTPNHHARATLSYGLVLAMHQTLLNATNVSANNNQNSTSGNANGIHSDSNNNNQSDLDEFVPSVHFPPNNRDSNNSSPSPNSDTDLDLDSDPASTLFLSRLLLGLSLFVLICLLSF